MTNPRRRTNASALAVLMLGMMASPSAYSAYICDGYVEIATGRGSELYLKSFAGSSWVALCSMTNMANNISVEGCKNAYALLLGAQLAKQRVRIWFNDSLTCSTQVAWSYAAWYFGPELLGE